MHQDCRLVSVKNGYATLSPMPIARFSFLLCLILAAPAQAEIYKYVDENGQVTFTDVYKKGAKRIELPGAPTQLPGREKSPRRASYAPSPADFPRIDPATQKRRDDVRRQVLQDEMSSERRNADEARRQLLKQQMSILVEQAEQALLRGDSLIYRSSLEALSLRLQQDLAALPHATLGPLLNELADLQAQQIQVDITALASHAALDALAPVNGGGAAL